MTDLTRRDALKVAAVAGVAALGGAAVAGPRTCAAVGATEIPVYLKVAKGVAVKLNVKTGEKGYKSGSHKPTDFPVVQKRNGDKLEITVPMQRTHHTSPKLTLTKPDQVDYVIMTIDHNFHYKVEVFYKDVMMNMDRCCWVCDGDMYCALPGFCVECGGWSYCCPLDSH